MMEDEAHERDEDIMLDQMALECMHAIEAKDKEKFLDSFHGLVASLLMEMQEPEEME